MLTFTSYYFNDHKAPWIEELGRICFAIAAGTLGFLIVSLLLPPGSGDGASGPPRAVLVGVLAVGALCTLSQCGAYAVGLTQATLRRHEGDDSFRRLIRALYSREVIVMVMAIVAASLVHERLSAPTPDAQILANVNRLSTSAARHAYADAMRRNQPFSVARSQAALREALAIDQKRLPKIESIEQLNQEYGTP